MWVVWSLLLGIIEVFKLTEGAVRAPPWADPELNPCATQPRGWQLIYWPPDGLCYKIFQIGYPCPETMELVPSISGSVKAECRCPPTSVLHRLSGRCYELFKRGPCPKGQYIAPNKDINNQDRSKIRTGTCMSTKPCPEENFIFWPVENKCYKKHTQGPCPRGQLLTTNSDDLSICTCSNNNEMEKYYWEASNSCYEHYTRGPCQEKGHLFLPERVCDCHSELPHYHRHSEQCYELESQGPCSRGHHFTLSNITSTAICQCKPNHIFWPDGNCYRPYTQGPCPSGQIIFNNSSCASIPCSRGFLYFPEQHTCYRVGSQGPCITGQVVTFDFRTRPSLDGISYNGICGCEGLFSENNCAKGKRNAKNCEGGQIFYKSRCYKLYSQGPCSEGQWLVPSRQKGKSTVRCDCRPEYTSLKEGKNVKCLAPSVGIANYLNKYFVKVA